MTATFDSSLGNAISRVRMMIGDWANLAKAQVQDETITAYLTNTFSDDETKTAIQLCYDLSAKWASITDAELDNQELKASHISANFLALAKRLEVKAGAGVSGVASHSGIIVTGLDDCRPADLGSAYPCCYP